MRFATVLLLGVLTLLSLTPASVMAQSDTSFVQDSVFVVPKVPVAAEANDATAAQRIALDRGRKEAMDILLRRLTAESDWAYLPRVAIDQPAVAGGAYPVEPDGGIGDGAIGFESSYGGYSGKRAVVIDPARLPALEEGFAVFNEKSSSRSYSAQITYRFKPEEIRELLKGAGIPYSESQTRTSLIIPILETENGMYLWESNNPWARAWLARPLNNELTPMLLPRGDREDIDAISPQQARSFNQVRLGRLAERYGVTQVIIAHGYLSQNDGQARLRVRLMDGFLNNQAQAARDYVPSNSAVLYDDDGFGAAGAGSGQRAGRVLTESWYREAAGDFPALARRAVESTVAKYAAGWKAQTLVDHSVSRTYKVNAWVNSIDELATIRQALEDSPLVEEVNVEAVASEGATIFIKVIGDIDQLVVAMRQRNLVFWTTNNIVWNIATPEKAVTVQVRYSPLPEGGTGNPFAGVADGAGGLIYGSEGLPSPDISPPSERELNRPDSQPEPENDLSDGLF